MTSDNVPHRVSRRTTGRHAVVELLVERSSARIQASELAPVAIHRFAKADYALVWKFFVVEGRCVLHAVTDASLLFTAESFELLLILIDQSARLNMLQ